MNKNKAKLIEKTLYNSLYNKELSQKMWDSTPHERNLRRLAIWRAQCLVYRSSLEGVDQLAMSEKMLKTMPIDRDVSLGHALDYRQF